MPALFTTAYWSDFFFGRFPADSLGYLRKYFGFALCIYFTTQYKQLLGLDPFGPAFHYTIPIWYFDRLGIERHVPWIDWIAFAALIASCVLFAIGRRTRAAIVAIIVCVAYLKGVRDSFSGDVHHREQPIIALLVLFLLSRCHEVQSADAARHPPRRPVEDWEASWPIVCMQIYVAFFYFWALMAKLRLSGLDWFAGGGRIQDMLISRALRDGLDAAGDPVNLALSYQVAHIPQLCFALGLLVFAFEFFAPLILFFRSRRARIAFAASAMTFHLANLFLLNVQFYFYPFVLMTFFNMTNVHVALRRLLSRIGVPLATGARS